MTDTTAPAPAPVASCCSAQEQTSCCASSEKASCCGAEKTAEGGCGCR